MNRLSVVITGATGMVGEAVLHECLESERVLRVLVIGRRSCQVTHPKLTEILHPDFSDFSTLAGSLAGFDTCFFCLGVSSLGMKEPEYTHQHILLYLWCRYGCDGKRTLHVGPR
jgi:putative NADH-flavin reductase